MSYGDVGGLVFADFSKQHRVFGNADDVHAGDENKDCEATTS